LHDLLDGVLKSDEARAVTIDATVMFADLRGYTTLTQSIDQNALTSLLDAFYDECATAIWRYDGLLNKTIGDAVFAIFNFPVRQVDHAVQAVLAARDIQRGFTAGKSSCASLRRVTKVLRLA
jgi:class 3 adenylate cyclase